LLTTSNPQAEADRKLLERLGIRAEASQKVEEEPHACDTKCGHAQIN
jgi:biotin synthase